MYVIVKQAENARNIETLLLTAYLPMSRFEIHDLTVGRHDAASRRFLSLKIKNVRLKKKKDYCGQHPNACVVIPWLAPRKHKRTTYLEGADWVAFNDMLNDLCDEHNIEANIWSTSKEFRGRMHIRREWRKRLAVYRSYAMPREDVTFWGWDVQNPSGDYANRFGCSNVPRSSYPEGTPGISEWQSDLEAAFLVRSPGHHEEHDHASV